MWIILFSRKGSNLLRKDSENELSPTFAKLYREPKCARCRIHGVISDSKGHKYICEYRRCACQKCRHVAEKQRVTAKRVANLREKRKRIQDPPPLLKRTSEISDYKFPNKEFENRLDQGCKEFNFQYKELYKSGQNDSSQKVIPSEEGKRMSSHHNQMQTITPNQYQFPRFHQPQKLDHMTQYNLCEERLAFQNKLMEKSCNRRSCEFTIQSILKRNEPYPNIIDDFSQVNYLIRYDIAWLEYKFPYLPAKDIISALSKANGHLPLALMFLLES